MNATCFASAAHAAGPSVWILRPPAAYHSHHQTYSYYPATGYGVSTPTYAYGWFGAKPRTEAYRHVGYYRHYTQWTFK
jgi:hypothetical protein